MGLPLPVKGLDMALEAQFNYYLQSKGQCFKLVSGALAQDHTILGDKAILIAVVLLMILDIFESGSVTWTFHLEGAKSLLDAGVIAGISGWDSSIRNLLREASM